MTAMTVTNSAVFDAMENKNQYPSAVIIDPEILSVDPYPTCPTPANLTHAN
jgi:hypothetical protein